MNYDVTKLTKNLTIASHSMFLLFVHTVSERSLS